MFDRDEFTQTQLRHIVNDEWNRRFLANATQAEGCIYTIAIFAAIFGVIFFNQLQQVPRLVRKVMDPAAAAQEIKDQAIQEGMERRAEDIRELRDNWRALQVEEHLKEMSLPYSQQKRIYHGLEGLGGTDKELYLKSFRVGYERGEERKR